MVEISIPLFEVEDMKTGRGGGKRGTGQKYAKYGAAVEPMIGFLEESIEKAKDGTIRVKVTDIAKQIGMTGKHETSIYWGLKFSLFQKGFVVTTGQTLKGDPVLVIRRKKEGDVLPASLAKHLGGNGETGAGEKEGEKEGVEGVDEKEEPEEKVEEEEK